MSIHPPTSRTFTILSMTSVNKNSSFALAPAQEEGDATKMIAQNASVIHPSTSWTAQEPNYKIRTTINTSGMSIPLSFHNPNSLNRMTKEPLNCYNSPNHIYSIILTSKTRFTNYFQIQPPRLRKVLQPSRRIFRTKLIK